MASVRVQADKAAARMPRMRKPLPAPANLLTPRSPAEHSRIAAVVARVVNPQLRVQPASKPAPVLRSALVARWVRAAISPEVEPQHLPPQQPKALPELAEPVPT